MRKQESITQGHIEQLAEKLHENIKKNINITNWYNFSTFGVIDDLVL
jgi:hypothetical protein